MRLLIIAVAAARLAQLIALDSITEGLRGRINEHAPGPVIALIGCGWCLTVWTTAAMVITEQHAPVAVDIAAAAWIAGLIMYCTRHLIEHT